MSSEQSRRSLVGRPFRRLRRWSRHTPGSEIALVLVALGVVLIFIALVIGLTVA